MKNGNPESSTVTSPEFSRVLDRGTAGAVAMIRARLAAAGVRCFANDSIGQHVSADDLVTIEQEVEERVRDLLDSLLIDVEADHNSRDTPARVARMFVREVFAGRYTRRPDVMDFPNAKAMHQCYTAGPITVRSTCAHHLCPIQGKAWCAVEPGDRIIGLSKFNRLCEWILSRPQIQEEAVTQLADELETILNPRGLAVVIRATHACMTWRGVREHPESGGGMVTMVTRGLLAGPDGQRTAIDLLKGAGF